MTKKRGIWIETLSLETFACRSYFFLSFVPEAIIRLSVFLNISYHLEERICWPQNFPKFIDQQQTPPWAGDASAKIEYVPEFSTHPYRGYSGFSGVLKKLVHEGVAIFGIQHLLIRRQKKRKFSLKKEKLVFLAHSLSLSSPKYITCIFTRKKWSFFFFLA